MAIYHGNLIDQLPDIPADTIVSKTLHNDDHVKVILFGFAAGQSLSEHTSSRPAILHIVEGEADVVLGDEHHEAGPGTWIYMEPELPHSIEARTQLVMLLELLQGG